MHHASVYPPKPPPIAPMIVEPIRTIPRIPKSIEQIVKKVRSCAMVLFNESQSAA